MTCRSSVGTALIFTLLAAASLFGCGGSPKTAGPSSSTVTGLTQRQVEFQQVTYPVYLYIPSSSDGKHSLPAIFFAHGFGGHGPDLISIWKDFAEQNGIILVGPTLPLKENFETAVAPHLYPAIMDSIRAEWNIDAKRIYLFGYSAGGYTVFDAGLLDSQYFAAVGVFAAIITPDYDWVIQRAVRKIPIAIYIGDHDQFFTVAQAQRTHDVLAANGFPVRLTVFKNVDHNYGEVKDVVDPDVWKFFSQAPAP